MIKRIITLIVSSSFISAGLLYLGITMMGNFSPALASSQNALVAITNTQNSPTAIPAGNSVPLDVNLSSGEEKLEVSSTPEPVPASPVSSDQSLMVSANSITTEVPVTGVNIAQLLNNPHQFIDTVFTISGIATSLGNGKFLLNDGTGQILVDIDADLVNLASLNGLSITVSGALDDSSNQTGFEVEASMLTYPDGTVVTDDCIDDATEDATPIGYHDCSNDNCSDDCLTDDCSDDCLTDDCSDDCLTDDCSDDDNEISDDDSTDIPDDDSSDISDDDSSDISDDDNGNEGDDD